jgi:uncharacterized membrane protein YgdD (TMEM256/DUF423 family)
VTTTALFLRLAALLGGTGVGLGAFAAHGLRTRLSPDRLATFETGARYQLLHAVALLAVVALLARLDAQAPAAPWLVRAAWCWCAGTLLFSGSLYLLALTGVRWFGAITPLGGAGFIAGWGLLLFAAARLR